MTRPQETVVIAKPEAAPIVAKPAPTVAQIAKAVGITPETAAKAIEKSKAKPAAKSAPVKKAERKPDANPVIEKMLKGLEASKPAEKKAAPKTPAAAKPVAKFAPKETTVVAIVAKTVKKGQPMFVIAEAARPGSGRALFAHTHAALTVLGLLDGKRPAIPASSLLTVMGQRAVTYHRKMANFEDAPDHGIRLSSDGLTKFRARALEGHIDGKLANGFIDLFTEGKVDNTGVAKANVYQAQL